MQDHSMPQANNKLRDERLRRQWTQQDLADHLQTTKLTIGRWERGISTPGPHFRLKLCALFSRSAEELGLTSESPQPSAPTEVETSDSVEIVSLSHSSSTPSVWDVPYRRNPYFTGRDELLHLLDQQLSAGSQGEQTSTRRAALTQPQAIKGLGGIGKTQIAVEYAYRARERGQYTHTLWINAASQEAIITSFTALADVLPEFAAKQETNQQKLVAAIKQWLEQCSERWLLIFDNADDLSLIQEYVPNSGNGSILLTTRANAAGSLATSIDVDKMGFVEGTHLLLRRAQRFAQASDDEVNEASNIVVALDHFPLALEQAGAYIEETGCSFSNYLTLYQTHRKTLLARRGAQSTNYPDSIATTWSLSFDKIEQRNPAAAELLHLCAFLAPDHIPEELLTEGAAQWPALLQEAVTDSLRFNELLEALLAFSLVKRLTQERLLSLHRLVQAVQMDRMDPQEQRQWAERVVRTVSDLFPADPKEQVSTWSQCLRYLEQVQACDYLIRQYEFQSAEAADLLKRAGIYLREHASYSLAESLFQQALVIAEQQGGSNHLQVASSLNDLGILYAYQGQYEQAEPLIQRALSLREQTLDPYHPEVASSLNDLGALYRGQGQYEQAEPLLQRALHIWEQTLGPHNSQLAYPLNNLGLLYREQGQYEQAEPLLQRALHIWEQTLGPHSFQLTSSLNNLGNLYLDQGQYEQAEPLYQRALHIKEQTLGPHHPEVAGPLNNLGEVYREQGQYEQAKRYYQRALHIWEQALGPHSSAVALPLLNLGLLSYEQGQYEQAELLLQQALHIREQTRGPHHLAVASPLNGLANLSRERGYYEQADEFYQRTLSIRQEHLGTQHIEVAETLQDLAQLRQMQQQLTEALLLYQQALAIREQVLGVQHPKTYETHQRLSAVLQALGKTQKATTLGPTHLDLIKRKDEPVTRQEQ